MMENSNSLTGPLAGEDALGLSEWTAGASDPAGGPGRLGASGMRAPAFLHNLEGWLQAEEQRTQAR
jgi:hypothetical protein